MAQDFDVLIDEFLGAYGYDLITSSIQSFFLVSPQIADERTRLYGTDVYNRMLLDEDVCSAFETRLNQACAEGLSLHPAEGADPKNPNDIKNVYLAFAKRFVSGLGRSTKLIARDIGYTGLSQGNGIAEVVMDWGSGEDATRLMLKAVKPREKFGWSYVVDRNGELQGLARYGFMTPEQIEKLKAATPDDFNALVAGAMIPRSKFMHFVNCSVNGSVTGWSVLNPAYTPWFMKTSVIPEFFKFLRRHSSPSIVGKVPKISEDPTSLVPDEDAVVDGQVVKKKKLDVLKEELMKFMNSFILVCKGGTEIDLLESKSNGEAFKYAMSYFGSQIHMAILGSAQATKEAQHESRSSKDTAQDVLGLRTMMDREALGDCFTWLIRLGIEVNFGKQALVHAPFASFTQIEQQDRFTAIEKFSNAYAKGFIKDPQLPDVYREVGLPELPEDYLEELQAMKEQKALERGKEVKVETEK